MPGRGIHAVAWLGTPSGTLWRGIPRYSVSLHNVNPPTSNTHNFFVRTPFWVFLDSMESSLSPSVLIASLKSIGIHDKKRDRYNYEIAIYVDLIWRGV